MKTITRITVLLGLMTLGVLAMLALPEEGQPIGKWLLLLIASKAVSFSLLYLFVRLYERWTPKGIWKAFASFLEEEEEEETL